MAILPGKFTDFCDIEHSALTALISRALQLKRLRREGQQAATLSGRVLAMIFQKPSTRTRTSFEAGMAQLGGHAIMLSEDDSQMSRGEPAEDTARVLSSMCDAIVIRALKHELIDRFVSVSSVPVISGLSERGHPCQILADLTTYVEVRGSFEGIKVLWTGDINNVCRSWMEAASRFGFHLNVASPEILHADAADMRNDSVTISSDVNAMAEGADLVVTDVWVSMGDEGALARKRDALMPYKVTSELLSRASNDVVFMHCLPAVRGEEVEADVIDGPKSLVWIEAENRLHAQKALLEWLILGNLGEK